MNNILIRFYNILSNKSIVDKVIYRTNEIDIFFIDQKGLKDLVDILHLLDIQFEISNTLINLQNHSRTKDVFIYQDYKSLFDFLYEYPELDKTTSFLVIDVKGSDYYSFDAKSNIEFFIDSERLSEAFWIKNYRCYLPLLKLFRTERLISEYDDVANNKILIIDNGKDRNYVNLTYLTFDKRLFSKKVEFNYEAFERRIKSISTSGNLEWLSCFKHNVVAVMSAQETDNKTFAELFLSIKYIVSNTERDFEIYISGFSFEKVSKALKDDKQKYFQVLNQAQDRIKSQVIAVPLSIGTSIYAFFQMETNLKTYYFILAMIAIYISFICWYLYLYDEDLKKLKHDIKDDTDNFTNLYPKVFEIFRPDFDFITKKVNSVLLLSNVIKLVIVVDWIVLLIYVIFLNKFQPSINYENYFRLL